MTALTPIQQAFADLQVAYRELDALPLDTPDAECEPFHARIDAARDTIRDEAAQISADYACKLRIALAGMNQGRDEVLQLYRLIEGNFEGDYFEDIVFGAIRQLEETA